MNELARRAALLEVALAYAFSVDKLGDAALQFCRAVIAGL